MTAGFADLDSYSRRAVRLLRLHWYRLHKENGFLPENNVEQMRTIGLKFFSHERFNKIKNDDKKKLVDIAIFDDIGSSDPRAWAHEFSKDFYPQVDKPVEVLAMIVSKLEIAHITLFLDTLDLLSPQVADKLRERLLDTSKIKELGKLTMQEFLRRADTKVVSDSLKVIDAELKASFLKNSSQRNRQTIEKDLQFQDTVTRYKGNLAVLELVRLYFSMQEEGEF